MCDISKEVSDERVGYKLMIKIGDKFISSFTGQEMKPGKVPMPPKFYNPIWGGWDNCERGEEFDSIGFYKPDVVGKTSCFLDIEGVRKLHLIAGSVDGLCIVKVTLTGEVYKGEYWVGTEYDCIASDEIESIELVKMLDS